MTRGASTEVKSGINVTALLVIGSILWLGFLGCAQCAPLVGLFGVCSVCPLSQPHHYISKSGAAKAKAIRRSRVGAKPRLCHETPQIRMIDMICGKIYLMHE